MNLRRPVLLAVFACFLVQATTATAAPTDPDPTFGNGGTVDLGPITDASGEIALEALPSGKLLVGYDAPGNQALVRRLNSNGSTDPTFGAGGAVLLSTTPGATNKRVTDIAVTPSGRIWVGGAETIGGSDDAAIWLLTPEGAIDTNYDADGVETFSLGTSGSEIEGVTKEGENVIATASFFSVDNGVAVIRSFPAGGFVFSANVFSPNDFFPNAVALRPDGSVMVAGQLETGSSSYMAVPRFDNTLSHDNSFGLGGLGVVGPPIPTTGEAFDVAVDAQNNTYAFGQYAFASAVGKLTSAGLPADGVGVSRLQTGGWGSALSGGWLTPGGKLFGTGLAYLASGPTPIGARFNSDLTVDPSFGGEGQGEFTVPTDIDALAGAVQSDGKYLFGVAVDVDGRIVIQRILGEYVDPPSPPVAATVKFASSLKSRLKASRLKSISGTAAGSGVSRIEIAVQKVDSKLLKKSRRCLFVKSSRGALSKVRSVRGKCSNPKWLVAKGTASWSYRLSRSLKPGRYVVSARATGSAGVGKTLTKKVTLRK